MNNENKAKNIAKHILETYPVINKDNLPNALWFSALEMAEWKDEQWKEKAQTAFCYVHNCIGQCHKTVRPCELREKFDDIMNGKWPAVEKTKTK